jgi:hypothetical protein
MKTYTEDEIREYIESHDDNDMHDQDELRDMFRSVYGRGWPCPPSPRWNSGWRL